MKQRGRRSQKAGLPPGTLVHIGERKAETVRLTLIQYCEGDYQEKDLKTVEDVLSALSVANPETITWLDIGGIHDLELIQQVGGFFQLHPLLLEDVVNTEQRPKEDELWRLSLRRGQNALLRECAPDDQSRADQPGPGPELRAVVSGKWG